ncbi:flagellar biosynthesis chaperone FliJ [Bradyrhizobium sp. JR6.1]
MEKLIAFVTANFAPLQLAAGAVLGFLATRFTMTKKERLDFRRQLSENGKSLMLAQQERYRDFMDTFEKYLNKKRRSNA